MLSQVDSEGHHYQVLTEVTDHKRYNSAITKVDGFNKSSNGNIYQRRKTHDWNILIKCKEGSVYWVPLKYLKHSNPVQLDEYDVANNIGD